MRILSGDDWRDGYLDEHRADDAFRIRVRALVTVQKLSDLYFVRERSLWRLWNYFREVGLFWVMRKVLSRAGEASRNQKFVSIGWGEILEAPPGAAAGVGGSVAFIAPCHPRAFERIVLPRELVAPVDGARPGSIPDDAILVSERPAALSGLEAEIGGWSPFSGRSLEPERLTQGLARVVTALRAQDWSDARRLAVPASSSVTERDGVVPPAPGPRAVLFGYGNYGKSVVLNNIRRSLRVTAIHEIDPTLMARGRDAAIRWDTSARLRDDEDYEVHLIASYHHTHAPLAAEALRRGATAVVEKPIATDRPQLDDLIAVHDRTKGRFFAGFHKRYSAFNRLALRDLSITPGEPVHYHAIVFEEPLPARHWYRWPSSRSRIVSNGCHWLDHFLYLNEWSQPVGIEVSRGGPGGETANVSVRLANGAFFTLLLTDTGSARIGVRDHIELRAGGVTVTIADGARYVAEDGTRILRRARVNKMSSYESMYRTIGGRIARGEAGDSARSIQVSAQLVLDVEAAFLVAAR